MTVQPSTAERILAAAADLTTDGWSRVTMPALAARAGVSRQTIYNEFGSRAGLAEAMILRELGGFLSAVDAAFQAHRPDVVASIEAAALAVMDLAAGHGLLRAIVSAEHGSDTELLPLLTSRGAGVQATSTEVLAARMAECYPIGDERSDPLVCRPVAAVIVRLVLSNVTQPAGPATEVAATIAWVARSLLDQPQVRLPPQSNSPAPKPIRVQAIPISGSA